MEFWILGGTAAFMMGLSKGGIPMLALLSVPLMSLHMDASMAAGLLLPIYMVADLYAVYLFQRAFSVRNLQIMLPGAMTGILIGFFAVSQVSDDLIKLLVAAIGLFYLFNALRGRLRLSKRELVTRPADVPRGLVWGMLSGLTSYISHAGGAPYQAYVLPQRLEKMVYLGTTTIFFAIVNLFKVPPYIIAGQITHDSGIQAVGLAPFALLGAWSGAKISKLLPEKIFFLLVEIALAVVSVNLLYDVVIG